jgi:dolichol-phosphate mannosyltransferase
MELSVIIPVYDCETCLNELCHRLQTTLSRLKVPYEILLVNDGSHDLSWETVSRLSAHDRHIKGIRLSRNFGQHHAITAGTDLAAGAWVVVMDCDLQDKPEEIPRLYAKAKSGFDIVFTNRMHRKDPPLKKIFSVLYNRIFEFLTGMKSAASTDNFSIVSRKVILSLRELKEQNRSYVQSLRWVGFKETSVPVEHGERYRGSSAYSFSKAFAYALTSIVAYSDKPLLLSVQVGFFTSLISLIIGIVMILRYYYLKVPIMGYTSLIVTVTFSTGLMIGDLGILGLYIGRIFNETKKRPLYIIQDTVGFSGKLKTI